MGVNIIFFAWVLLVLAAAVWIAFNVRRAKAREQISIEYLEKQNQLMERIAAVLEKIEGRQSGQPG